MSLIMPSSDSEDFESADEGHTNFDKKDRKKRLSSSNYSDNALETEQVVAKAVTHSSNVAKPAEKEKDTDGWDDFDIDDDANVTTAASTNHDNTNVKNNSGPTVKDSNDSGWDDFDDWGQDDGFSNVQRQPPKSKAEELDTEVKAVTDKMSTASTGGGWGWSMHSLLNTATAGITTLTSQVSQGISTVLETGIGAPEPEELARKVNHSKESKPSSTSSPVAEQIPESANGQSKDNDGAYLPFGSLLSGVTKFVETTGPKVISGGLDTLETIGKKTMEILQDGDPGLVKKRAMLGLNSEDKPVLSQVLREAREKAEAEDKNEDIIEDKRPREIVNYESLFNDFDGPVYLEALKLLSTQTSMRIEEQKRTLDHANRQAMEETLEMVVEIYELPEKEDEEDEEAAPPGPKPEALLERLQRATEDLSFKLHFQPLIKQYTEVLEWVSNSAADVTMECIYKRAISSLAQAASLSMHLYHKTSELILASKIRSTVDESTALSQLTVVLRKHISDLAAHFAEKLNSISTDNKQEVNEYITNIFLEAGNSSTYLENAFQLALPIVQIGAI